MLCQAGQKKACIQDSLNYHVVTESLIQEILHRLTLNTDKRFNLVANKIPSSNQSNNFSGLSVSFAPTIIPSCKNLEVYSQTRWAEWGSVGKVLWKASYLLRDPVMASHKHWWEWCNKMETASAGSPFIALNIPRGHPPPPDLLSLILTSYITHLSRSHSQIKGFCVEHGVHFDSVVRLCNKIKPSPFLPDWIKRMSRLIWKSVSNSAQLLFGD